LYSIFNKFHRRDDGIHVFYASSVLVTTLSEELRTSLRIDGKGGSKGAVAKLTVRKTGLQGSFRKIQRPRDSAGNRFLTTSNDDKPISKLAISSVQ
jgi:hypothetical protein